MNELQLAALQKLPLVEPGDDLASLLLQAAHDSGTEFQPGDCLVVAQKIISKSENRYRYLDEVAASGQAQELATKIDKDPRLVQCILDESQEVLRHRTGVLIVRHRNGYVHANAGIDQSNIQMVDGRERVLLLPEDPDRSARELKSALEQSGPGDLKIVISDSAGRPFRHGIVGFALATAGFNPIKDCVGKSDLFGKPLRVTEIAIADEIAAAASLLMGQGGEGLPVVIVRGLSLPADDEVGSAALIRNPADDLFSQK